MPGERVFGLTGGGAYAQMALLNQHLAMRMPDNWSFDYAAAIPEAFFTAQETLFSLGGLSAGESVLIHAGASGVGTAGIQMATHAGATVYVTAGSTDKIDRCLALGAEAGICYHTEDFVESIQLFTRQHGVNLVQDFIGAAYWKRNIQCLSVAGRMVLVGLMGGHQANVNLATLIKKRLQIRGFMMRNQPLKNKAAITQRFLKHWMPALINDPLTAVIDQCFPLAEAFAAHQHMEENRNIGKIILIP